MERASSFKYPPKTFNDTKRQKTNLEPPKDKRKYIRKDFNNQVTLRRYNLRRRSVVYSNPFRKNSRFDRDNIEENYLNQVIKDVSGSLAESISNDQKVLEDENNRKTKSITDSNNNVTAEPPVVENIVSEEIPKENTVMKTTVISECSNLLENITSVVVGEFREKTEDVFLDTSSKYSIFPLTNTLFARDTESINKATPDVIQIKVAEIQYNATEMTHNKENAENPPLSPTF